jgi:FkbM family methyltransferase
MLDRLRNAVRDRVIRHYGAGFDISYALHRMRRNNFKPSHIFDVGAYQGEFAKTCREIWPDTDLTCFEVLPHRVKELKAWAANDGKARLVECLLGSEVRSNVAFHQKETASSVLSDHVPDSSTIGSYPMRTVDDVVASGAPAPTLLKLDVQGYEYEVLKGASNTLPKIGAVLAEVNLLDIYKEAHLLADVVGLLSEHRFVAYDICGFWRRPLDDALWTADVIFVPDASPLRADKRWSAAER